MEISYECALEYFIEMDLNSSSYSYLESASYVLFISDNLLFAIHKQTGTKSVFMEIIKNRPELIGKKMICTYMDMIYYVSDNNLCYFNLDTNKKGTITHLTEEIKDDGTNFTVENIYVYKGNKLIAGNRFLRIVDLETGKIEDIKDIKLKPLSSDKKYFIHNDYLYFADTINQEKDYSYKIYKYNINSGVTTEASDVLNKNLIIKDGIVENYYFIIEDAHSTFGKHDRSTITLFNLKETGEIKLEGIRSLSDRIVTIKNYGKNLIYIDTNKYNLTSYDISNNTKKILVKNLKVKVPFFRKRITGLNVLCFYHQLEQDRLLFDEVIIQSSCMVKEYIVIGKWLLYRKNVKSQPEIIPVC